MHRREANRHASRPGSHVTVGSAPQTPEHLISITHYDTPFQHSGITPFDRSGTPPPPPAPEPPVDPAVQALQAAVACAEAASIAVAAARQYDIALAGGRPTRVLADPDPLSIINARPDVRGSGRRMSDAVSHLAEWKDLSVWDRLQYIAQNLMDRVARGRVLQKMAVIRTSPRGGLSLGRQSLTPRDAPQMAHPVSQVNIVNAPQPLDASVMRTLDSLYTGVPGIAVSPSQCSGLGFRDKTPRSGRAAHYVYSDPPGGPRDGPAGGMGLSSARQAAALPDGHLRDGATDPWRRSQSPPPFPLPDLPEDGVLHSAWLPNKARYAHSRHLISLVDQLEDIYREQQCTLLLQQQRSMLRMREAATKGRLSVDAFLEPLRLSPRTPPRPDSARNDLAVFNDSLKAFYGFPDGANPFDTDHLRQHLTTLLRDPTLLSQLVRTLMGRPTLAVPPGPEPAFGDAAAKPKVQRLSTTKDEGFNLFDRMGKRGNAGDLVLNLGDPRKKNLRKEFEQEARKAGRQGQWQGTAKGKAQGKA